MLRAVFFIFSLLFAGFVLAGEAQETAGNVSPTQAESAAETPVTANPAKKNSISKLTQPVAHEPLSAGNAMNVFSSLMLVLVVLIAVVWLMKRFQVARPGTSGAITLISQMPVGAREKVVLLRIGEENILVGSSPAGVNRLHSWQSDDAPVGSETTTAGKSFGAALQTVIANRGAAS